MGSNYSAKLKLKQISPFKKLNSAFSFLIVCSHILLAFPAFAKSSVPLMMNDFNSFSSWLGQHTTYECSSNSEIQAAMARNIPEILYYGLSTIYNINPDLVARKLGAKMNSHVTFTCAPHNEEWRGLYSSRPINFDSTNFQISLGRKIWITDVDISFLENTFAKYQFSVKYQSSAKEYLNKLQLSGESNKGIRQKNSILHEYLHFLNFDNVSLEHHKQVYAPDVKVKADDDLVYSCTELAYPSETLLAYFGGPGAKIIDIGKACYLCGMAKVTATGIKIDASRAKDLKGACTPFIRFQNSVNNGN